MIAKLIDNRLPPLLIGLTAGLFAVAMAFLFAADAPERALLAARWTARAALPVFLVTYLASSLVRLHPTDLTKAVMRRRRQWGLGFAIAHTIHLAALLINITIYQPRPLESLIAGAIAYSAIYIMALTSTNAAQRRMGRWWKRIHTFGIHYVWFIFTASYALSALGDDPQYYPQGWALMTVMVAALGVRVLARRKKKAGTRGV